MKQPEPIDYINHLKAQGWDFSESWEKELMEIFSDIAKFIASWCPLPDAVDVDTLLPTEEDFRRELFHKNEIPQESESKPTYRAGLIDGYFHTIRLIKSRLAGK